MTATLPEGFPAAVCEGDQLAGLAELERIALLQAERSLSCSPPPPAPRAWRVPRRAARRGAAMLMLLAAAALALYGAPGPAGAQDVRTWGKPFCGTNAWTWIETDPRLVAHDSAGSCVEVPDPRKAQLVVTQAPGNGSFPNIGSGFGVGGDSCPSYADRKAGLCLRYPARVAGNWDPVASVKGWLAPGYEGNFAFDTWFSASPRSTSFQSRCSTVLSKADTEIMVWLAHPGDWQPRSPYGYYTTRVDGRMWHVMEWETTNHCPSGEGWRLVIYTAPRVTGGTVSVHNLKLNDFWGDSIRRGFLRDDEWLDAIDLGWEMDWGGTGNAVEGYTLRAGRR